MATIAGKYTEIQKAGKKHQAYFTLDVQKFAIGYPCTIQAAEFIVEQFESALAKVIMNERMGEKHGNGEDCRGM